MNEPKENNPNNDPPVKPNETPSPEPTQLTGWLKTERDWTDMMKPSKADPGELVDIL